MHPKHEHDCDTCHYLKTVNQNNIDYDLYFHSEESRTVIARFGQNGDYISGLDFVSIMLKQEMQNNSNNLSNMQLLNKVIEDNKKEAGTVYLLGLATKEAIEKGLLEEDFFINKKKYTP